MLNAVAIGYDQLRRTGMNNSKTLGASIAFALWALVPIASHAEGGDGWSVSMDVPVVCELEADTFVLDAQKNTVSGVVSEFCNSAIGFQVVAAHRPLRGDERVAIDYGGTALNLERSGLSMIAFRSGARVQNVPVAIRAQNVAEGLAVSLAITAI